MFQRGRGAERSLKFVLRKQVRLGGSLGPTAHASAVEPPAAAPLRLRTPLLAGPTCQQGNSGVITIVNHVELPRSAFIRCRPLKEVHTLTAAHPRRRYHPPETVDHSTETYCVVEYEIFAKDAKFLIRAGGIY